MTDTDRKMFLYDARTLTPGQRNKLAHDYVEQSKLCLEQALQIDQMYRQMDYSSMRAYETDKHKEIIGKLGELMKEIEKL